MPGSRRSAPTGTSGLESRLNEARAWAVTTLGTARFAELNRIGAPRDIATAANVALQVIDTLRRRPGAEPRLTKRAERAVKRSFAEFNNDSLLRYNITAGVFTQFPVPEPSDVVVDSAGRVWFTAGLESSIGRLDPTTGAFELFPVPDDLFPRPITVATDGQIWFTSRFVPQGVGRLNPATRVVTTFLTPTNPGPEDIAASPDGTVWFTQSTRGNIARIDNAGVIAESKAVKGSEPLQITVAPNGDPWYTMLSASKIGTVQLR